MTHKQHVEVCNFPEAIAEIDGIYTNRLPLCVDGVQWHVNEYATVDNITGIATVEKQYKQGANGVITLTAPTGTVITEGACTCDLIKYYELNGVVGAQVSRWLGSAAVNPAGGGSALALDAFTASDPVTGLPTHVNPPTSTTIEPTFDILTTLVGSSTQTIIEAYINIAQDGFLRDIDGAAEAIAVYIDDVLVSNENGLPPFSWLSGASYPITAGIHKITVYIHDSAGTNSGFDLQYSNDETTWTVVIPYQPTPYWECKHGYICNGEYLDIDKTTTLIFSDTLRLCEPKENEVIEPTATERTERIHENFVVTGTTPLVIPAGLISISVTKTNNTGIVNISGDNATVFPLTFNRENFTDSVNEEVSTLSAYTITGTLAGTNYKVHTIR